jgi:hypothetical protein
MFNFVPVTEMRNAHNILVGIQWKRLVKRQRGRCEDNIRMDLRDAGREGVN